MCRHYPCSSLRLYPFDCLGTQRSYAVRGKEKCKNVKSVKNVNLKKVTMVFSNFSENVVIVLRFPGLIVVCCGVGE